MPQLTDYISTAEAAKIMGVDERHVRDRLAEKKLIGNKIGPRKWLVLRSSAEAFERKPGMGRPAKKRRKSDTKTTRRKPKASTS